MYSKHLYHVRMRLGFVSPSFRWVDQVILEHLLPLRYDFEHLVPFLIIKTHFQVSLREVVDEVVAAEAVEDEVCSSLPCCLQRDLKK